MGAGHGYKGLLILALLFFVLPAWAEQVKVPSTAPQAILLDMDFGNGIDDAMTLRLFLLAARRGEITPLAVALSNPSEWAFPAANLLIEKLLPGRAVPLGKCHEDIGLALEDYTRPLAEKYGKPPAGGEDSVVVLRRVLQDVPDHSVHVVCTGFGTNLAALLETEAHDKGDACELSGTELVQRKVSLLVLMAGLSEDPAERSFNVIHNIGAFRTVAEEWPSPVFLVTPDLGDEVLLDLEQLVMFLPAEDPYRDLAVLFKERKSFRHDPHAIPSWDQIAFLFAAYPNESLYTAGSNARLTVTPNGILKALPGEDADPPRYPLIHAHEITAEQVSTLLMERYQSKPE